MEGSKQISGLSTKDELLDNLQMNCVPIEIMQMGIDDYNDFLISRRKLMSAKIKKYYQTL